MVDTAVSKISADDIKRIISAVLSHCHNRNGAMVPARGTITNVSKLFRVSKQSVSRIWTTAVNNKNDVTKATFSASPQRRGPKVGCHLKWGREAVTEEVTTLQAYQRRTIRSLLQSMGIPHATIHRFCKYDKIIRRSKSHIKPSLTESNKFLRMMYAADQISYYNHDNNKMYFDPYKFEVHLDEKWFFMSEVDQSVYLTEEEEAPQRSTRHKSHITKVMFLAAVARLMYDLQGRCFFDGKIGMWPFTRREAAQRTSVNRVRGTLETKAINVTYDVYTDYVINLVLPVIKQKWPRLHARNVTIGIQQDNAPSHFTHRDLRWQDAINREAGWSFHLKDQPPNSPDTNALDLGFFQSMQWGMEPATNIDTLIERVKRTFTLYDPNTLDRVWMTHQAVQNEIMACNGCNHYKARVC
jgi:hypothetical protein